MSNSKKSPKESQQNGIYDHHHHHEPHSKTLPQLDMKSVATARALISTNSFSSRTHELNLSLDVNDEELSLNSHLQSYYQPSPANSIHSIHSMDRSSPSSLLLHQSVTSYPNLPSLNLNDSKTNEENVLCALEPSPKRQHKCLTKPKLLREAAKSEPPHTSIHKNRSTQHIKSSKSLIHHITSQPPPMPCYYIHQSKKRHHPIPNKHVQFNTVHSSNKKNTNKPSSDNVHNVRVMRDKEVLQIDEEIPIEKFISALKKGYARIMTQDDQNEEYKRSARIARSVSVGNMQAYKDEILAEQQERRKKRKKRKYKKRKSSKKYKKKDTPKDRRKRNGKKHYPRSATERNSKFKFSKHLTDAIPPKLEQGSDSDSSSMGDLVGPPQDIPPQDIEVKQMVFKPKLQNKRKTNNKKLKRSQTHENRERNHDLEERGRSRSKTADDAETNDEVNHTRNRANCYYSSKTPSVPKEDDVLDIDHSSHSGHSSCGFSSDSDSSSTDHGCEMEKPQKAEQTKTKTKAKQPVLPPTPALKLSAKSLNDVRSTLSPKFKIIKQTFDSDDDDDEHEDSIETLMEEELDALDKVGSGNHLTTQMYTSIEQHTNASPLKLAIVDEMRQKSLSDHIKEEESSPIRGRSLSNSSSSSASSNSSSISSSSTSSSSGSSDWDQEVREEEEEAVRQQRIAKGILSDEETATESESEESEQSSELATSSDSDDEYDGNTNKASISLAESLTESESEPECDDDKNIREHEHNEHNYSVRPRSTPFRSSKGTTAFLSHLKRYGRSDLRGGNLNDFINESRGRSPHVMMNNSITSLIQNEAKRKRKNISQQITKEKQSGFMGNLNPMKMKNKMLSKQMANRKQYKAIQKRKNALNSYSCQVIV